MLRVEQRRISNGVKKIALAHDHLFQIGGAEKVLASLVNIFSDSPVYTLINNQKVSAKILKQDIIRTSYLQKIPNISAIFKYFLVLMPRAWQKIDLSDFELIISSSSSFVKGVSHGGNTKHICYCHAPTRYLWDEKEEYIGNLPEGRLLKKLLPRVLEKLQNWDFDKAQKVDYFIANSNYIADKIRKYYKRKSLVIYPPIKVADFFISDKVEDYYLIVSRLRPYKKVDLAITAFNNLKLPLKIIG
ncbi:MAG: glycosyltransferase, partial [bacterium]|nr:glycosyltransferase [bacterium]